MFWVNFVHKIQGLLTAELHRDARTVQMHQSTVYWNSVTGALSNHYLGWMFAIKGGWFQKRKVVQGSLDSSRYSLLLKIKWKEEGSIFRRLYTGCDTAFDESFNMRHVMQSVNNWLLLRSLFGAQFHSLADRLQRAADWSQLPTFWVTRIFWISFCQICITV